MAFDYEFTCPLPNGMHARPASALEHVARRFAADVSLTNERTGRPANAKSVLGIVSLDIRHGDRCLVVATGRDAAWAIESLRVFVDRTLPRVDDVVAAPSTPVGAVTLPPVLRHAGATVTPGVAVVSGIGIGRAVAIGGLSLPDSIPRDRRRRCRRRD